VKVLDAVMTGKTRIHKTLTAYCNAQYSHNIDNKMYNHKDF